MPSFQSYWKALKGPPQSKNENLYFFPWWSFNLKSRAYRYPLWKNSTRLIHLLSNLFNFPMYFCRIMLIRYLFSSGGSVTEVFLRRIFISPTSFRSPKVTRFVHPCSMVYYSISCLPDREWWRRLTWRSRGWWRPGRPPWCFWTQPDGTTTHQTSPLPS